LTHNTSILCILNITGIKLSHQHNNRKHRDNANKYTNEKYQQKHQIHTNQLITLFKMSLS